MLKKIDVEEKEISFVWDDDTVGRIKPANLRKLCPCSICEADYSLKGQNFITLFSVEEISVKKIEVLGHYSIKIIWNDGHDAGFYSFDYLKKILKFN